MIATEVPADLPEDHPRHPDNPPEMVEKLVTENIRLVSHMLKEWGTLRGDSEYDDLFSAGMLGLLHVSRRFDVSRGFKFSTIACIAIRRELCKVYTTRRRKKRGGGKPDLCLHTPNSEHEGRSLEDQLIDEQNVDGLRALLKTDDVATVMNCVMKLTKSQQKFLALRFGMDGKDPHTLVAIGMLYGVTGARAGQLESKLLKRLAFFVKQAQKIDETAGCPS